MTATYSHSIFAIYSNAAIFNCFVYTIVCANLFVFTVKISASKFGRFAYFAHKHYFRLNTKNSVVQFGVVFQQCLLLPLRCFSIQLLSSIAQLCCVIGIEPSCITPLYSSPTQLSSMLTILQSCAMPLLSCYATLRRLSTQLRSCVVQLRFLDYKFRIFTQAIPSLVSYVHVQQRISKIYSLELTAII